MSNYEVLNKYIINCRTELEAKILIRWIQEKTNITFDLYNGYKPSASSTFQRHMEKTCYTIDDGEIIFSRISDFEKMVSAYYVNKSIITFEDFWKEVNGLYVELI